MAMPLPRQHLLASARRLFTERGAVPDHMVAESILRSWRRCADLGYDMHGPRPPQPLTQAELREARQRHETLRRISHPALELLSAEARRTRGLVILTDADGLVLDAAGSTDFADRAARVALMPGAAWSESAAGTNAIGTALVERRPIAVHGGEHFFEPHRILTCAAVPITDPRGRTIGLLDLSGRAADAHGHALGLVRMAVDEIERRMLDEDYGHCLRLGLHTDPAVLGTAREAVLAFDGEVLAAANRHALRLLGLDAGALGIYRYGDLFAGDPAQAAAQGRVQPLQGGGPLAARVGWPREGRAGAMQGRAGARNATETLPADGRDAAPAAHPAGQWTGPAGQTAPDMPANRLAHMAPGAQAEHAVQTPRPAMTPSSSAALSPATAQPWFDPATLAELARAVRLLDAGVSVLLLGETGSGKEVFARQMHARSRRAGGPFVAVNCAALPEGLIESELFGYENGAFTGARRQGSKGLLRQAEGGVLFLDEIGDMPLALQARLLRVLQAREVVPLGGGRAVPVDFVPICATHQPLEADAAAAVRADLYFRIAEYTVRLPALRDRADRAALVRALWQAGGPGPRLPAEVVQRLAHYPWPGNFRQLAATLRTLRVLAAPLGEVRLDMLPADVAVGAELAPAPAAPTLQALADAAIHEALAATGGNVSRAARRLGMHRSTLYRRLGRI